MEKVLFKDRYPVYSMEILKENFSGNSIDDIIEHFKKHIQMHPIAEFITVFDNYAHTAKLNGEISDHIKGAKNLLFCFGRTLKTTKDVSIRPRSIAICELENSFTVDFVDPPKETARGYIIEWCELLQ